jgi:hypothetical protein
MRRFRFRIGTILIVVVFLAVGVAALREASDVWESGVFSLTVAALLNSILLAIYRTGKKRAFWTGFALFGCVYLMLTLIPPIGPRLITSRALTFLDSKVRREQVVSYVGGLRIGNTQNVWLPNAPTGPPGSWDVYFTTDGPIPVPPTGVVGGMWSGTSENFWKIGHSLLALIVAGLGGLLSRALSGSNQQTPADATVAQER